LGKKNVDDKKYEANKKMKFTQDLTSEEKK